MTKIEIDLDFKDEIAAWGFAPYPTYFLYLIKESKQKKSRLNKIKTIFYRRFSARNTSHSPLAGIKPIEVSSQRLISVLLTIGQPLKTFVEKSVFIFLCHLAKEWHYKNLLAALAEANRWACAKTKCSFLPKLYQSRNLTSLIL